MSSVVNSDPRPRSKAALQTSFSRTTERRSNKCSSYVFESRLLVSAVTNARFAALHGLAVAPYASRRRPFHSAKPRARHERQWCLAATSAGFRLRLGGGVALRLRSSRLYACASLFPLADRRPKPVKIFKRTFSQLQIVGRLRFSAPGFTAGFSETC